MKIKNNSRKPCVVILFKVGAACRVTIDENLEPKSLILSIVARLFDAATPLITERGGVSVAVKLIRLCNGSTSSGKLFILKQNENIFTLKKKPRTESMISSAINLTY